jgi:hypothetical protein
MPQPCAVLAGLSLVALAGRAAAQEVSPPNSPSASTCDERPRVETVRGSESASAESRTGRVVVESLVGLGAEAGLGIGGAALTIGACGVSSSCSDTAVLSMAVGGTVGAIGGVLVTGSAMKGNGSFSYTVLGGLAGGTMSFYLLNAINRAKPGSSVAPELVASIALPVLGSVLGYELSSDTSARPAERAGLRLRVGFVPEDGGGFVGAFGQF